MCSPLTLDTIFKVKKIWKFIFSNMDTIYLIIYVLHGIIIIEKITMSECCACVCSNMIICGVFTLLQSCCNCYLTPPHYFSFTGKKLELPKKCPIFCCDHVSSKKKNLSTDMVTCHTYAISSIQNRRAYK